MSEKKLASVASSSLCGWVFPSGARKKRRASARLCTPALAQAQLPGSRDQLVEIGCGGGAAGRKRAKQAQETAPAARRGGHRAAGKKNTQWTATGCPLAEYELEALQIEAAYCASSRSELRTCFSATTICSVAALSDGKIRERFSWTTRLNAARCSSRTPIR